MFFVTLNLKTFLILKNNPILTVVAKSLATLENLLKKSKKLIKFGLMEYN